MGAQAVTAGSNSKEEVGTEVILSLDIQHGVLRHDWGEDCLE